MREAASDTSGKVVRFVYGGCKFKGLKKDKTKKRITQRRRVRGQSAESLAPGRLGRSKLRHYKERAKMQKAPDFVGGLLLHDIRCR
jgi:hypothetical protein